jgi:hypothetical protein
MRIAVVAHDRQAADTEGTISKGIFTKYQEALTVKGTMKKEIPRGGAGGPLDLPAPGRSPGQHVVDEMPNPLRRYSSSKSRRRVEVDEVMGIMAPGGKLRSARPARMGWR